tara:strand:- start:438 stop:998 length:561 start_codon:yes stop_codon:yes gene_type:complete
MGKRSNFERNPKDFYETPIKAVKPLIPHLPGYFTWIEPCVGEGKLANHIETLWPSNRCVGVYDFHPNDYDFNSTKADASIYIYPKNSHDGDYRPETDLFITNPPWSRDILHPIIDNLAGQKPTWLLFDSDWMHTKQAIPYLEYCVKIVSVGRVSWMENGVSGMDNCCWYLFDKTYRNTFKTIFIGR